MRLNIVTSSDTSVYAESHTTATDANGIVIVDIGGCSIISGSFFSINWENDFYGLQTEIDPEQDGSFVDLALRNLKRCLMLIVPWIIYGNSMVIIQLL